MLPKCKLKFTLHVSLEERWRHQFVARVMVGPQAATFNSNHLLTRLLVAPSSESGMRRKLIEVWVPGVRSMPVSIYHWNGKEQGNWVFLLENRNMMILAERSVTGHYTTSTSSYWVGSKVFCSLGTGHYSALRYNMLRRRNSSLVLTEVTDVLNKHVIKLLWYRECYAGKIYSLWPGMEPIKLCLFPFPPFTFLAILTKLNCLICYWWYWHHSVIIMLLLKYSIVDIHFYFLRVKKIWSMCKHFGVKNRHLVNIELLLKNYYCS